MALVKGGPAFEREGLKKQIQVLQRLREKRDSPPPAAAPLWPRQRWPDWRMYKVWVAGASWERWGFGRGWGYLFGFRGWWQQALMALILFLLSDIAPFWSQGKMGMMMVRLWCEDDFGTVYVLDRVYLLYLHCIELRCTARHWDDGDGDWECNALDVPQIGCDRTDIRMVIGGAAVQ
jgi:hypothetical protein